MTIGTQGTDWFVRTAGIVLERLGSPHDPGAVRIAAELIDSVRDNFRERDRFDALFARWREVSRGPASDAGLIRSWIRTPDQRRPDVRKGSPPEN